MTRYEYKVLPAPRKPRKAKGLKTNADRFANMMTEELNVLAAEGWEYVRSDTLPMDEKPGMFKKVVETFQAVIVFRRALPDPDEPALPTIVASREVPEKPEKSPELSVAEAPEPSLDEKRFDPIGDAVAAGRKSNYWD